MNDKLRLVPGHCDPAANVHDYSVLRQIEFTWRIGTRTFKEQAMLFVQEREIADPMMRAAAFDVVEKGSAIEVDFWHRSRRSDTRPASILAGPDQVGRVEAVFLEIGGVTDAIHHGKQSR